MSTNTEKQLIVIIINTDGSELFPKHVLVKFSLTKDKYKIVPEFIDAQTTSCLPQTLVLNIDQRHYSAAGNSATTMQNEKLFELSVEITDPITGNLKYVTPRRLKITQGNWNDNHFIYVSKPTASAIAATR